MELMVACHRQRARQSFSHMPHSHKHSNSITSASLRRRRCDAVSTSATVEAPHGDVGGGTVSRSKLITGTLCRSPLSARCWYLHQESTPGVTMANAALFDCTTVGTR
jgi:hypothetical protein